jgi:amino acid adenylation domain-containing protein
MRPFDLQREWLFRGQVLRLGEDEHVLLLTMHHIVADGWSLQIMVREFSELYAAFIRNEESPLEELKIQYADYATWQRNWLQGDVLEEELAYWRGQLSEVPALELPTDQLRSSTENLAGATLSWELPPQLSCELRTMNRREGVTLFMTLLTGFYILLSRYSGQKDIAVGVPVAGRRLKELEDLIGFFVNTLVLRTELESGGSFRELLRKVRETTLEAHAHQDVPFEKLVEELRPERDLARSPFFQAMLVLQNAPAAQIKLPGLKLSVMEVEATTAKFDLLLTVSEEVERIQGTLNYRTELFSESSMKRLLEHWQNLLQEIAAAPGIPVQEIRMLSEPERHQMLVEWNGRQSKYDERSCVHQFFEEQVKRSGDAPAVEFGEQRLSYIQVERRANQLGRHLRKLGVGPDVCVGISLERSVEMVISLLAVLKAGGAYVPLDPKYPMSRLSYMLENAGIRVLITQDSLQNMFAGLAPLMVVLDDTLVAAQQESEEALNVNVHPDNLAYVIYTSGSTGNPKGVAMPHRPLVNLLNWQVSSPMRTLQFTSLSFDVSFQEMFVTFSRGGCLVLVDEETRRDPQLLWRLIADKRIERIFLPFVALQQLAEAGESLSSEAGCLQQVITAGEQLKTTPTLQHLFEHLPGCTLENQYGPSETHVITSYRLDENCSQWAALPPIGKAIENTQVYVLNEGYCPMPIGVAGELYLGGVGLSRGYMNRPDWTAERFVPDPFHEVGGGRLYRTGDLVRYRADGNLEFLGRKDQQIKMRGYRVEPGEIETALSECDGVAQAAVVVFQGQRTGETRLAAYVVPKAGANINSSGLRNQLRKRLPEYMVPASIVEMHEFPLTPSGKIDRKRLPEPEEKEREDQYVGPRTGEEEILCGMWAEVLKQERVGIEDNFFELGGHSLLATQLMARIRKVFEVELALRELFEAPTIAGLGKRMAEQRRKGEKGVVPGMERAARAGRLPLSYAQQRLWFLDQLQPNSAVYNIPMALRLKGKLEVGEVERVLQEMVRRHEVLRTRLEAEGGEAWQVIDEAGEVKLGWVDLSGVEGEEEREEETRKRVQEEAMRPFDLQREWLFRGQVLRLGEDEHVLLLTMHHIVCDEWSIRIMVREFVVLYQAYHAGLQSPLKDIELQYADFALWQRNWLQGDVLEEELVYWKRQLSDLPTLQLPVDYPHSGVAIRHGGTVTFELDQELCNRLKQLCRREGATPYMGMLAVFQVFLAKYTGQKDIAVGSPVANRLHAWTQDLIGFFANMIVLRTNLHSDPGFLEVLDRVRKVTLAGYDHQDLPFDLLVEAIPSMRNKAQSPLQAVLSFHTAHSEKIELSSLQFTSLGVPSNSTTKFDLTLHIMSDDEQMNGAWEYNAELFEEETVRQMTGHFIQLLRSVIEDPAAPISRLQMLSSKDIEILRQAPDIEDFAASDFAFEEQPLTQASEA